MKTWVIGDVHGCAQELDELVKMVNSSGGDARFIFLGDLVHKGPDSSGVVRQVRNIVANHPGSICISGNHEEIELRKPTEGLSEDDVSFLKSLPLLHQFEAGGRKYVAVHGGIPPSFSKNYPEGIGDIPAEWHKGGGKKMDRLRRFLRTRYVNPAGDMVAMGQEKPEDMFWAEIYQGEYGTAIFGHDPSADGTVRFFPNAVGLDTGCVFGQNLTAYCLEDGLTLQVKAGRQYAQNLHGE